MTASVHQLRDIREARSLALQAQQVADRYAIVAAMRRRPHVGYWSVPAPARKAVG